MHILLRPFNAADVPTVLIDRDVTDSAADLLVERLSKSGTWTEHELLLAVEVDGRLAGDVQLRHCAAGMPSSLAEVGIEIYPEFRGQGVGLWCLQALTERGFADGFRRIVGSTDEDNAAMRRVFEKAGWQYEATLREFMPSEQGPRTYIQYVALASQMR